MSANPDEGGGREVELAVDGLPLLALEVLLTLVKARKEWDWAAVPAAEVVVEGARKDWLESRKEWFRGLWSHVEFPAGV